MTDYEAMYSRLFQGVTEAILALQRAQSEAEDIYIETCGQEPESETSGENNVLPNVKAR